MPRRNITVSLDDAFIAHMDTERGTTPRSRWLEERPRGPTSNARKPNPRSAPVAENRAHTFRKPTPQRPIIQKRGKT